MADLRPCIPAQVDDYGFTPNEFRIWGRVARRGTSWENLGNIAKACRMDRKTVQRVIKSLTASNVLEKESRCGQTLRLKLRPFDQWIPRAIDTLGSGVTTEGERRPGGQGDLHPSHLGLSAPYEGYPSKENNKGKQSPQPAPASGGAGAGQGKNTGSRPHKNKDEGWLLKDLGRIEKRIELEKQKHPRSEHLIRALRKGRDDINLELEIRGSESGDSNRPDAPITGRNAGFNADAPTDGIKSKVRGAGWVQDAIVNEAGESIAPTEQPTAPVPAHATPEQAKAMWNKMKQALGMTQTEKEILEQADQ